MDSILETAQLLIRKVSLEDAEQLYPILGDPEVMRYSLTKALDRPCIIKYIDKILLHYAQHGYGLWVVILKETNQVIGLAGLLQQIVDDQPCIEVAYRLAKKYWGKGLGTKLVKAIKCYAFDSLAISRLIAIIEPENIASVKVALRIGMSKIKSRIYKGVVCDIYALDKIVLLDSTALWKQQYANEVDILKNVFGLLPSVFYHIGSTCIPECLAQPIIDILLVTKNILDIDGYNALLENVGYTSLPTIALQQKRFFRKRDSLLVDLYIFEDCDPEIARHLRFRDYLMKNSNCKKSYSSLKRRLLTTNAVDSSVYNEGKKAFVKKIDYLAAQKDRGKFWQKMLGPRKENWVKEEIIAAMQANMYLHMTYFAVYLPIMKISAFPDVTAVITNFVDDTFNYVLAADFAEKDAYARIVQVLALFKNLEFSWWVFANEKQQFLPNFLQSEGLSVKEEDIGMSLCLADFTFINKQTPLEIKRVLTKDALQDFADVFVDLGAEPSVYEKIFSTIPVCLYGEKAPLEMYVGYIDNIPVITAVLVLYAHVAGIYYVMTRIEYRKRGYATQMLLFLLSRAKKEGYSIATLQASEKGKSLYQKLGFISQCRFVEYACDNSCGK